jgi:hypothetical protein
LKKSSTRFSDRRQTLHSHGLGDQPDRTDGGEPEKEDLKNSERNHQKMRAVEQFGVSESGKQKREKQRMFKFKRFQLIQGEKEEPGDGLSIRERLWSSTAARSGLDLSGFVEDFPHQNSSLVCHHQSFLPPIYTQISPYSSLWCVSAGFRSNPERD